MLLAQGDSPIQWTTSVEKVSDTQYLLVSKATLKKGWHLYSQTVPENGPSPTMFLYDDSEGTFTIGRVIPPKKKVVWVTTLYFPWI